MKFSIKTKLLAMYIGLILLMTLSLSFGYYMLAKRDKNRESQQRIQIAFDVILDDLAEQLRSYTGRFNEFFQQEGDNLYLATRVYGDSTSQPTVGVSRTFITSRLTQFGQTISADRMIIYSANRLALARYSRRSNKDNTLAEEELEAARFPSEFEGEFPTTLSTELFTEEGKLGMRIIAPLVRDNDMSGVVIGDRWLTQHKVEHYGFLSKTVVNFFAGTQWAVGGLPVQKRLEKNLLVQSMACEAIYSGKQNIETFQVLFEEQQYYQGCCALRNAEGVIGAITVSLSQEIEAREIRKILMVVISIAGAGIIICIILISGVLVPRFIRPIIKLTQVSLHIAEGKLDQEIDTSGSDELGILARGFAYMRDEIQKKIGELQQLNDELEQRVKKRTAELAREKYILDTFMATVPNLIYFKDCEGRITRANKASAKMFGFDQSSGPLGKTDFDLFPKEEAQRNFKQEQEIIRTGQPLINEELPMHNPDGSTRWSLVTKMPLRDEHGTIIGTFGISRNITKLKQAEQELAQYRDHLEDLVEERTAELSRSNSRLTEEIAERARIEQALRLSEEQYRLLAENVMDGIIIVQKGCLVFTNVAFAVMTGNRLEQLTGNDPESLFHERTKQTVHQRLASDDSTFQDPRWQAEIMTNDGRTIWTEIDQTRIMWNSLPAILLTIRDITDRKLKEQRLKDERARLRRENLTLKSTVAERYKFGELVGKSSAMQQVYELIVNAAASEVNVLICGESGTGKELIAQTIHQVSRRKTKKLVSVNCASIPETLFEREFFGHRRGAFTGADRDTCGLFDQAHQGTLFLDEVTELTPGTQAKLLRVLQDGEYLPLGSPVAKQADAVIVAATNKDVKSLIEQGALRRDFFYRVCVIEVKLPPLRERKEDLPLLIEHFLDQYRRKQEQIHGGNGRNLPSDQTMLPAELVQMLYTYDWPGNIRELQNVLKRYLATRDIASVFSLMAVPENLRTVSIEIDPQGIKLPDLIRGLEKQIISNMLSRNQHHTGKTADKLGIARRTLQQKIKQYQLTNGNGA